MKKKLEDEKRALQEAQEEERDRLRKEMEAERDRLAREKVILLRPLLFALLKCASGGRAREVGAGEGAPGIPIGTAKQRGQRTSCEISKGFYVGGYRWRCKSNNAKRRSLQQEKSVHRKRPSDKRQRRRSDDWRDR